MKTNRNFAQTIFSTLMGLALLAMSIQPVAVSAASSPSSAMLDGDIRTSRHPQTGMLTFLGADPSTPIRVDAAMREGLPLQERGLAILDQYGPEFGLQNPREELTLMSSHEADGRGTVRYQQVHQNVPVMGGELIVNTDSQGALLSINGEVSPSLNLSTEPAVGASAAREQALKAIARVYGLDSSDLTATDPVLWIYDARLLNGNDSTPAHLVWRVEISSAAVPIRELVLVNANSGEISLHFNQIDTAWETADARPEVALEVDEPAPMVIAPLIAAPVTTANLPPGAPDPSLDRFVATTGANSGDCSNYAAPCVTINYAISKAVSGDTIGVTEGTYTRSGTEVALIDKSVNLSGGWNAGFDARIGFSVIDGQNARRGLLVNSSINVALEYLIVTRGFVSGGMIGGGIANSGNLTISHSSINSNEGGGISNGSGNLTIANSTISNNRITPAGGGTYGAGIYVSNGTANLNYVTLSNNSASYAPAIYKYAGTLYFKNSIIAGNTSFSDPSGAPCGGVYSGNYNSQGYNIIDKSGCGTAVQKTGDQFNADPHLGFFLAVQGYHPLLSNSTAINNAGGACDPTDQRGMTRTGACDIGAYEYTTPGAAASVSVAAGSNQHTRPGTNFPLPLTAVVLDSQGNPVSGVGVTFTAPASGPSGTFTGTGTNSEGPITTDGGGAATTSLFTANSQIGSFVVNADAGLGATADFALENLAWYVAPSGNDSNSCKLPASPCASINAAINKAADSDIVFVAVGTYVGTGTEVVLLNKSLTLSGGWNSNFTQRIGRSTIDGQNTRLGIRTYPNSFPTSMSISNFTIRKGYSWDLGGGIYNDYWVNLTVTNFYISDSSTHSRGGAVDNDGIMILNNSTIYRNSAYLSDSGVIYSTRMITINNSTISKNADTGITGNHITINNSTISENRGSTAGGIWAYDVQISNSIVANNTGMAPDCYGSITSRDYNIVGNTASCTIDISSAGHDQLGVQPQLTTFFPVQGYYALLPTSPAINAGNPAALGSGGNACLSTDQRGLSRAPRCDIGAYEYKAPGAPTSLWLIDGSPQVVTPGVAFSKPLRAAVLDAQGSPVSGVSVTFAAPANGASGKFAGSGTNTTTISTNSGGVASTSTFTANMQPGSYLVSATAAGVASPINFSLHNGFWMVAPTGNNSNNCVTPSTPCATIQGVLQKSYLANGNEIRVAVGTYNTSNNISISKSISLKGGWNTGFTSRIGASVVEDIISVSTGAVVSLSNFTIQNILIVPSGSWFAVQNHGTLSISNSTIKNNKAGIDNYGSLTVMNSTITDNGISPGGTNGYGSGIHGSAGTVTLMNVTITNNTANTGGGISGGDKFILRNTIIAGNHAEPLFGEDCSATVISLGYNLIGKLGDSSGGHIYSCKGDWASTDIVGDQAKPVNANFDKLTNMGYGVWIRPLKLGSPAIDAGNTAPPGSGGSACPVTDQLGVARPQGVYCDIGAVEFQFNEHPPASLLVTYTAGNTKSLPGTQVCSGNNGFCAGGDTHAQNAQANAYSAFQWYQTWFGRNSIDRNGIQINSTVHYGSNYQSAFWNGHLLVYGDGYGFPFADDVVAHEYTHGVTQYESNLFYWYQSGAINESFSDLWGEAVDQVNGRGNDAASVKWLIGENVTGHGAFRNMADPPAFNQPDSMTSNKYCEGGTCLDDNGGIHINSGVNNKAAYLMVAGGTFNNKSVSALGWTKVLAIYYEAQTNLLTSGSDYLDLYNSLYQACLNKVGTKGITNADCQEVRDATDAVKMNLQPAVNFNPDAPYCPVGTSRHTPDLFYDNLETGTDGWTFGALSGESAWGLSGGNAASGAYSLWADDGYEQANSFAAMTKGVSLPAGSKPFLHFAHAYGFESDGVSKYYDGGVLEYSINNGTTWIDAKTLYSAGQDYKGTLETGNGNPLGGRSAFAGDSHGYVDSRYNLASLAGKTVRFRWRAGTDRSNSPVLGWYMDDIRIYTCVGGSGAPSLLLPKSNAMLADFTPTFDWSDSTSDLHHYELQLATDPAFTLNVVKYNNISASTYTINTALNVSTKYYWRVRTYSAVREAGPWSEARYFRTAFASPTGGKLKGITTGSRLPTFAWNTVVGATSYRIQISTTNTFATPLIDATMATRYFTPTADLPAATTLYWRVQVSGGAFAPGRWSVVWSFTTP